MKCTRKSIGFPLSTEHSRPLTAHVQHNTTQQPKDIEALAARIGKDNEQVAKQIKALEETNPMLGLRGCRLGLLYPEISEMQVRSSALVVVVVVVFIVVMACARLCPLFGVRP